MNEDRIRILRIIEYDGPRTAVEAIVAQSIQGEKHINGGRHHGVTIKVATLGMFPEILNQTDGASNDK